MEVVLIGFHYMQRLASDPFYQFPSTELERENIEETSARTNESVGLLSKLRSRRANIVSYT